MSKFYSNESLRAEQARNLFDNIYGIPFKTDSIGPYKMEGDLRWKQFVYAIFEDKLEINAGGAEPLFQSIWYYIEIMRRKLDEIPDAQLPCLLLYAFGKFRRYMIYCPKNIDT
jgi:hypothetical protein